MRVDSASNALVVDPKPDALAVFPTPKKDTRPDDALVMFPNAGEGRLHALCQSLQGVNIPLPVVIQLMALFLASVADVVTKSLKCNASIAKCSTVTVNNNTHSLVDLVSFKYNNANVNVIMRMNFFPREFRLYRIRDLLCPVIFQRKLWNKTAVQIRFCLGKSFRLR